MKAIIPLLHLLFLAGAAWFLWQPAMTLPLTAALLVLWLGLFLVYRQRLQPLRLRGELLYRSLGLCYLALFVRLPWILPLLALLFVLFVRRSGHRDFDATGLAFLLLLATHTVRAPTLPAFFLLPLVFAALLGGQRRLSVLAVALAGLLWPPSLQAPLAPGLLYMILVQWQPVPLATVPAGTIISLLVAFFWPTWAATPAIVVAVGLMADMLIYALWPRKVSSEAE